MAQKNVGFGLTLSNRAVLIRGTGAKELIEMARQADASGLVDSVWVGDSILSKPRLECIPLLGAIASHTSRVRLGVACMATLVQRNPVLFGLQWASLDVLSGGRTLLAACLGYPARQHPAAAKELEVMGVASKERPKRLEEMIQALRHLWTSDHAAFRGKYYRFEDVNLEPKPVQKPCPIYIAATPRAEAIGEAGVERALRRIARYADGWMTNQIRPDTVTEYLARIRRMLSEEGRDPARFRTVLYYGVCANPNREQALREAKGFLDAYYAKDFTHEGVEIWTACGPIDHCVQSIQSFIDAGIDHITIRPIGSDMVEQFRLYLNDLLPALGVSHRSETAPLRS